MKIFQPAMFFMHVLLGVQLAACEGDSFGEVEGTETISTTTTATAASETGTTGGLVDAGGADAPGSASSAFSEDPTGNDTGNERPNIEQYKLADRVDPRLAELLCIDLCTSSSEISCGKKCTLGNKVMTCEQYGAECTDYYCGDGICLTPESCANCASDCGAGAFKTTEPPQKLSCQDSCINLQVCGIQDTVDYHFSFPNCIKTVMSHTAQFCEYRSTTKEGHCGVVEKTSSFIYKKSQIVDAIVSQVAVAPWVCW